MYLKEYKSKDKRDTCILMVYCSSVHNSSAVESHTQTHTHTHTHTHTMKDFSVTKKNEIMSFAGKWIELEIIMLSDISQAQKAIYCMFSLICGT
jgi:hypothetical protein